MMTDWSKGLVKLGLADQDWGPTVFDSYADLKKNWRGSKDCPNEDALKTAISEAAAEEAKVKYKEDRRVAYASIGDQLDNITKTLKVLKAAGTDVGSDGDAQIAMSDAVKAAHPKP